MARGRKLARRGIWRASVTVSMAVGFLWMFGFQVMIPGGLMGGPTTAEAWETPEAVEVALR